jgi:hypothetical protein
MKHSAWSKTEFSQMTFGAFFEGSERGNKRGKEGKKKQKRFLLLLPSLPLLLPRSQQYLEAI